MRSITLKSGQTLELNDKDEARHLAEIISEDGHDVVSGKNYAWSDIVDTLTVPDFGSLLPTTIEYLVREPVDPIMNILPLFTKMQFKSLTATVTHGIIGSNMVAQKFGELGTLPEQSIQFGGGLQITTTDKYGIQISYSDEVLRNIPWSVLQYNLKEMKSALNRQKEQQAVDFLRNMGNPLFNNLNPTASQFGVTTGRGIDFTGNGSLAVEDLFKAMVYMIEEGFTPTALVMSPMMFLMYTQDPVLRNLFLLGQGGSYFQLWTGQAGPLDPWSNGAVGDLGPSRGNKIVPSGNASGATPTGIAGREHGMTAAPPLPQSYFPWSLKIIVSPFIPYDAATELGDIYIVSEGKVGFYMEETGQQQVEWRDEDRGKTTIRLVERYTFGMIADGQGVGVFKNVKAVRNYWDGFLRVQHTATLSPIGATDSVV